MSSVSSVSGVSGVASLPSVVSSTPLGIVLEDGYVLPPPPSLGMPGVWRHKATLVMSKDALLPDRCVKCNVPTPGRLKRKLSWHHPAIYIIVLFAILIYLIVALILRKTATVDIGICDEHRAKRRRNILITWVLFVLGVGGFILAITTEDPTYLLFGTVALFGALIFGLVAVRIVTPSKIDDKFVWLKGVNKEYLDELPQWVG
ncbi:MAG: hypothetical protein AABN95_06735 [Acidobacteriota bacterium]